MLNLSLSGCGFLGIYHIGVISAFREHAPEFLQDKISGCSAGALVAACAFSDCCLGNFKIQTIFFFTSTPSLKSRCRSYRFGRY